MSSKLVIAQIYSETSKLENDLIRWRREIHANPELRFQEYGTSHLVKNILGQVGLTISSLGKTDVITIVQGDGNGPTLAIRADLDALPIEDKKNVSYASKRKGISHACGHDAHTTICLGTALVLSRMKEHVRGRIKFIFQPGEEVPSGEASGADMLISLGVLERPKVDAILGFHCWPDIEVGRVGLQHGCTMASVDLFRIEVKGESSHAASAHLGKDAILAASSIILNLQSLISRGVSANDLAILNIGTIEGGKTQSVVADRVVATGTLRTVSQELRESLLSGNCSITCGKVSVSRHR